MARAATCSSTRQPDDEPRKEEVKAERIEQTGKAAHAPEPSQLAGQISRTRRRSSTDFSVVLHAVAVFFQSFQCHGIPAQLALQEELVHGISAIVARAMQDTVLVHSLASLCD